MVLPHQDYFLGTKTVSCHRELSTCIYQCKLNPLHLNCKACPPPLSHIRTLTVCNERLILPYKQVMLQQKPGGTNQETTSRQCNCFHPLFCLFAGVHLESSSINHPELCEKEATQPMVYVVSFDNSEYSKLQCCSIHLFNYLYLFHSSHVINAYT